MCGGYHIAAGGGKLKELCARILGLEAEDVRGDVVNLLVRFRSWIFGKALLSTQDISRCGWEAVFPTDCGDVYLDRKASGTHITRRERKFARTLSHLAEKILFMIKGVTTGIARVEPRWEDGDFPCVPDRSDESYVGTERGVHKVWTLRRRKATERADLKFLNIVTARIWDGPNSVNNPVRVVLPDVSSLAVRAEADAPGKARRLYITMKYGLTEGCIGCRAIAGGKRTQDIQRRHHGTKRV